MSEIPVPTNQHVSHAPTHNVLLTIPRTASHLVVRLLNLPKQPNLSQYPDDGYFFIPALRYRHQHDTFGRPMAKWTNEERTDLNATLQESLDAWKKWITDSDMAGNSTYVKEHLNFMLRPEPESAFLHPSDTTSKEVLGNPTCLPDDFLQKICPTFLIRHPTLCIPSMMRTTLDLKGTEQVSMGGYVKKMRAEASYKWHVALYKYILSLPTYPCDTREEGVTFPIILDAADLLDPALVKKYARAIGLDERVVQFQWESKSAEGESRMAARMKDTLLKSESVVVGKLAMQKDIDLEEKEREWKGEFGEVLGHRVAESVRDAMADYEWLYERRMRV